LAQKKDQYIEALKGGEEKHARIVCQRPPMVTNGEGIKRNRVEEEKKANERKAPRRDNQRQTKGPKTMVRDGLSNR